MIDVIVFAADSGCTDVDCHNHGTCVILPSGQAQCQCNDPRYTHSSGAGVPPGDCADETQNGVTCHNGGSCV